MKKSFLVLLLAVLLPSLLLGWLALRSAQEQGIILERRTAELCQRETDNVATTARSLVNEQRRAFVETVRGLLTQEDAHALAGHFGASLRSRWPQPALGFALDDAGRFLSPTAREASTDPTTRQFLRENSDFLANKETAPAYAVAPDELNRPEIFPRKRDASNAQSNFSPGNFDARNAKALPNQQRNVVPQQQNAATESQVYGANAEFRQFTAGESEGVVNRFVNDRLNMIFWVRPTTARDLVFGCLLHAEDLRALWDGLFAEPGSRSFGSSRDDPAYILALLDDKGQPVAISPAGSPKQDWRKPFAATEIGEALPHWEAALYLRSPSQLTDSARRVQHNLSLLIACALAAIAAGGWTVFRDTRRQLAAAQKKTDFVSNVSHELKTPLTSIRMFAELIGSGRAAPERQAEYLRIITVEAERLTRLINNVLDFSALDRRQRRLQKVPADFHAILAHLWPAHALHLHEAGFATAWESAPPPYPIVGDHDALAQVLTNLLSNAEKYSVERKEITIHSFLEGPWVCLSVLDRGPGVPAGEERKIFEPFYRANDSLSSGVPGTGLGLALALRVVREHGGEILYQNRPGGGSNFTVRLPLAQTEP